MSLKLFVLIIGGILAITGAFLGIGATVATTGAKTVIETSRATLEAVHKVSERTGRIETRQEIIMNELNIGHKKHSKTWGDPQWQLYDAK